MVADGGVRVYESVFGLRRDGRSNDCFNGGTTNLRFEGKGFWLRMVGGGEALWR